MTTNQQLRDQVEVLAEALRSISRMRGDPSGSMQLRAEKALAAAGLMDDDEIVSQCCGAEIQQQMEALRVELARETKRRRQIDDEAFTYSEQVETLRRVLLSGDWTLSGYRSESGVLAGATESSWSLDLPSITVAGNTVPTLDEYIAALAATSSDEGGEG